MSTPTHLTSAAAGSFAELPDDDTDPYAWLDAAACAGQDPGLFFSPDATDRGSALALCTGCPVLEACRSHLLRHADVLVGTGARQTGVLAGTTGYGRSRPERRDTFG